jgi:hypothetical protein
MTAEELLAAAAAGATVVSVNTAPFKDPNITIDEWKETLLEAAKVAIPEMEVPPAVLLYLWGPGDRPGQAFIPVDRFFESPRAKKDLVPFIRSVIDQFLVNGFRTAAVVVMAEAWVVKNQAATDAQEADITPSQHPDRSDVLMMMLDRPTGSSMRTVEVLTDADGNRSAGSTDDMNTGDGATLLGTMTGFFEIPEDLPTPGSDMVQ